jgi:CRP-like cAMP-binding protein
MQQFHDKVRTINPLNSLGPEQFDELLATGEFKVLKKKDVLFRMGDNDATAYYLLDGHLTVSGDGGIERQIFADSDNANYAIGNLQPRPYTALVGSKTATIFKVSREFVEQLAARSQMVSSEMPAVQVMDVAESEGVDGAWMFKVIQSDIFRDLPTENIENFFAAVERVDAKEGDSLVKQGDPGDYYYMIVEGECKVTRKAGPIEFEIAKLGSGDSFGEEALISGMTRNASVEMLSDGVVMRLSKDNFAELIKRQTIKALSAKDAARQMQDGSAVLLDVRLENEHGAKSIRGSLNIPLFKLRERIGELDKEKTYILYCDTGARSSSAAFVLRRRGYDAVYLEGGLSSLMPGE